MKRRKLSKVAQQADEPRGIFGAIYRFGLRHELTIVLLLCLIGTLRVLAFCGAFPFFNNVDEQAHFDMVCRYAKFDIPHGLEGYSKEALDKIPIHSTWEYFVTPEDVKDLEKHIRVEKPAWRHPNGKNLALVLDSTAKFKAKANHEAIQPPFYYLAAGLWYNLGKVLGLDGLSVMYWLKMFNVIIYALMLWFSYVFMKRAYPSCHFLHFGLPAILAFMPQDLYYGIESDVPSALLFGAAFFNLVEIYRNNTKGYLFYAFTGLFAALALLAKLTNAPIYLILGLVVCIKLYSSLRDGTLWATVGKHAVLCATAAIPVIIWFAYNQHYSGTFTLQGEYTKAAGWTPKPFGEMFNHPAFTVTGFSSFWHATMSSYWRGEYIWHALPMARVDMDYFYSITSALFFVVFVIAIWSYRRKREKMVLAADILSAMAFAASIGMLIAMSIRYDYGNWFAPSQAFPFFAAGRLISGTMLPFLAMYLMGMSEFLSVFRLKRWRSVVLALIIVIVVASEMAMSTGVFASQFNLFHNL